jgi:poly-gamma-glutamate synthase PgsB/CapB
LTGAELLAGLAVGVCAAGVAERVVHERALRRIPIRIHVNGTRGKSSVTRLIAAALRAAGRATCAKTTGTLPRFILPDGSEVPVFRPSRPNVIEQIRIVRAAAAQGAEVLVMECMAVQPELQWLSEARFVRATHGVITNARPDHLDQMGPGEDDVAWALAGMIPPGQALFTAERRRLDILRAAAADRGARLVAVDEAACAAISPAELSGFAYTEHPDNVALALAVVADLGVDRETALGGMFTVRPDAGALTFHTVDFFGRRIHFVNGFAANDPESTEQIWRMALARHPEARRRVAVFNCRADRPDRSAQLGAAYPSWPAADAVVLIGTGTYLFARAAAERGLDPGAFIFAEDLPVAEIFEAIISRCGRESLVMGLGNIGGPGLALVHYFRNREVLPREETALAGSGVA